MSKEIKERKQAVPKTIKVKTVVIGIVWTLTIAASLMLGWFGRSSFESTVRSEVSKTVHELSAVQLKQ